MPCVVTLVRAIVHVVPEPDSVPLTAAPVPLAMVMSLAVKPVTERTYGYGIRHKIIKDGLKAFDGLDTRQLFEKLWEIKFFDNRIMYVIVDKEIVHFLHACNKQSSKSN